MALQKEVWKKDIIGNLFKNNQFAERCVNADEYVLAGKVVHMPVAATPAGSKKNLTTFPQTATKRADREITYSLDKYYRLPITVEKLEQAELSYDKRQSVVGEDESQLIQDSMDGLLLSWSPSATAANSPVIFTVGDVTGDNNIAGSTGNRKMFTKAAFQFAALKFAQNRFANMPKVALLTATHYYEFLESLSEGEKTAVGRVADMAKGIVGQYYGFEIMLRDTVIRYRKSGALYLPVDTVEDDYAAANGDVQGSLFYADTAVERAKGEINVFDDTDNPLYYGDIFSCDMRLGGRIRRDTGVLAVADTIVAA